MPSAASGPITTPSSAPISAPKSRRARSTSTATTRTLDVARRNCTARWPRPPIPMTTAVAPGSRSGRARSTACSDVIPASVSGAAWTGSTSPSAHEVARRDDDVVGHAAVARDADGSRDELPAHVVVSAGARGAPAAAEQLVDRHDGPARPGTSRPPRAPRPRPRSRGRASPAARGRHRRSAAGPGPSGRRPRPAREAGPRPAPALGAAVRRAPRDPRRSAGRRARLDVARPRHARPPRPPPPPGRPG